MAFQGTFKQSQRCPPTMSQEIDPGLGTRGISTVVPLVRWSLMLFYLIFAPWACSPEVLEMRWLDSVFLMLVFYQLCYENILTLRGKKNKQTSSASANSLAHTHTGKVMCSRPSLLVIPWEPAPAFVHSFTISVKGRLERLT